MIQDDSSIKNRDWDSIKWVDWFKMIQGQTHNGRRSRLWLSNQRMSGPQNCPAILGITVFHPSFTHLWNSPMDSSVNHLANPANTGLGSPTGKHYKTLELGLPYCQTIARSNFRHQKPGKTTKFKPCSGTCEAADRITFCGKALPLEASAAISWNHSR